MSSATPSRVFVLATVLAYMGQFCATSTSVLAQDAEDGRVQILAQEILSSENLKLLASEISARGTTDPQDLEKIFRSSNVPLIRKSLLLMCYLPEFRKQLSPRFFDTARNKPWLALVRNEIRSLGESGLKHYESALRWGNSAQRFVAADALCDKLMMHEIHQLSEGCTQALVFAINEEDNATTLKELAVLVSGAAPGETANGVEHRLVELLSSNDHLLVGAVISALGAIGDLERHTTTLLAKIMLGGGVNSWQATWTLATGHGPADISVPALTAALADKRTRAAALRGLGAFSLEAQEAVPAIAGFLDDENYVVRCNALRALSKFGDLDQTYIRRVVRSFTDSSQIVREDACEALVAIGDRALSEVVSALHDGDPSIRGMACIAALGIAPGDLEVRRKVRMVLEDNSLYARRCAAQALLPLVPDPMAMKIVREALAGPDVDDKVWAIGVLSHTGRNAVSVLPWLKDLSVNAENAHVRRSARAAVGAIENALVPKED